VRLAGHVAHIGAVRNTYVFSVIKPEMRRLQDTYSLMGRNRNVDINEIDRM
jgi:hypothetical protein